MFDLKSLKYLYSYGNRGRSNKEFVSSINFNNITPSEYLEVLDAGTIKYIAFSDSTASITKSLDLPLAQLKNPINRLKKINDTTYYFDNLFEEEHQKEFLKLNLKTEDLTEFSPYPRWNSSNKSSHEKFLLYSKVSTFNSDQNKIAAFYFKFPVMKIIDATTGEVITETHLDLPRFSFNNVDSQNLIFGGAHSSDNYIYAMWLNFSKADISVDNEEIKPVIMVFDWSGNLVTSYKLAHMAVTFTVYNDQSIYTPSFGDANMI